MEQERILPTAVKMLSDGLQESATQLVRGDVDEIAKKLKLKPHTVRGYTKGEVADIETGRKVLKAMRKLVIDREKDIKQLVA